MLQVNLDNATTENVEDILKSLDLVTSVTSNLTTNDVMEVVRFLGDVDDVVQEIEV